MRCRHISRRVQPLILSDWRQPAEPVMPAAGAIAPTRRAIAELLAEARTRTLLLVSPLSHHDLIQVPEPEVGSVLSHLAQIVSYEESQLLGEGEPSPVTSYDEWFDRMTEIRQKVLQRLEELESADQSAMEERYHRVVEHEYQREEAILESLDARSERYHPAQKRRLPRGRRLADPGMMVRFPGGTIETGPPERTQTVSVQPFWIDIMPVTNGDYMTFMGEGGYANREVWSDDGWDWLKPSHRPMPRNWIWQDGTWWLRCMGRDTPLDFTCPVTHLSCYEAEAFARFVGKRLPSELEWEAAAGWDPETQCRRQYPWGNMPPSPHVANLDQLGFGPASVGAFPGNVSPVGCYGMIGDVWEWTAEQVLRGGSWATRPGAIQISTRRAAGPADRHLFTGFRCARDG
jgi:gamma-glutamyl hercynylcysteine S-oxide synthase